VARWIGRTLAADPPRARSLLVTVWGDALEPHGGVVWLSSLIRLMAPFGINERLVRTSVFRLAADGWLAAETVGRQSRYHLTASGARRFADAYRRIYAPPQAHWDGEWEVALVAADLPSALRAQLRDELRWAGFGAFAPGVYAHPAREASAAAPIAAALGVADRVIVLSSRDDPQSGTATLAQAAAAAWDLPALAAAYRRLLSRFGAVIDRFRQGDTALLDAGQCFVVRSLLIHAYRRVLLRDPQLPASLLPPDWPGAAAYALTRDFYRLTHAVAERHLAATCAADGDALPPADTAFYARFGGLQDVGR